MKESDFQVLQLRVKPVFVSELPAIEEMLKPATRYTFTPSELVEVVNQSIKTLMDSIESNKRLWEQADNTQLVAIMASVKHMTQQLDTLTGFFNRLMSTDEEKREVITLLKQKLMEY